MGRKTVEVRGREIDVDAASETQRRFYVTQYQALSDEVLDMMERDTMNNRKKYPAQCIEEPHQKIQRGVFPYVVCPRDDYSLDPLEGCEECGGVGYHISIENPEF